MTLDEILMALKQYGHPNLYCHSDGKWSASVKITIKQAEITFDIRSSFEHTIPKNAAMECLNRTKDAFQSLGIQ